MSRFWNWKSVLVVLALCLVTLILYKFNQMANEMAISERAKVKTLISGFTSIMNTEPESANNDVTFASEVVTENKTIPLILTDVDGAIIDCANLDTNKLKRHPNYLANKLEEFKAQREPLVIDFKYGKSYVYYGDSKILTQLRYYPYFLVAIIILFLVIVFIAYSTAQKSIQNLVWMGMAKETAHQMGTPLSSIVGWMEILKMEEVNRESISEMDKDVQRLQLVAERFSKIGAIPQLDVEDLLPRLENMVAYMGLRSPQKVTISLVNHSQEEEVKVLLNGPLFDWVIENLIRNALDAMKGEGQIEVALWNEPRIVTIEVSDTGKGLAKKDFRTIFRPGYSTKTRGWGLGLSLAKRIIEQYHNGSIYVKQSVLDKGTTFKIILRR